MITSRRLVVSNNEWVWREPATVNHNPARYPPNLITRGAQIGAQPHAL